MSKIVVFHHIPKCGGNSVNYCLQDWFNIKRDYRSDNRNNEFAAPINPHDLVEGDCLSGHWDIQGYYLHQRYPEVFEKSRFRLFSFLRDPLSVRLSLFRHEKKIGILGKNVLAKDIILSRPNYIANRFPLTKDNYVEILNRYEFIGILERGQESLDKLAKLYGKPRVEISKRNTTQIKEDSYITTDDINRFKELNQLDYKIYNYCLNKFFQ